MWDRTPGLVELQRRKSRSSAQCWTLGWCCCISLLCDTAHTGDSESHQLGFIQAAPSVSPVPVPAGAAGASRALFLCSHPRRAAGVSDLCCCMPGPSCALQGCEQDAAAGRDGIRGSQWEERCLHSPPCSQPAPRLCQSGIQTGLCCSCVPGDEGISAGQCSLGQLLPSSSFLQGCDTSSASVATWAAPARLSSVPLCLCPSVPLSLLGPNQVTASWIQELHLSAR